MEPLSEWVGGVEKKVQSNINLAKKLIFVILVLVVHSDLKDIVDILDIAGGE